MTQPLDRTSSPAKARVPKASDVLGDQLRADILGRGLKPGDEFLSEAEIMEKYVFSRGTVRETLRLLETEGLITVKRGPYGGIRVAKPDIVTVSRSMALYLTTSDATLRDFVSFRQLIEPAAAGMAAEAATASQREWLIEIANEDPDAPGDLGRSADLHRAIGQSTNNDVLAVVLASMHHILEWHTPGERLASEEVEAMQRVHRRIAQAIHDGEASAAAEAMRGHLAEFARVLSDQGRLDEPIIPRSRWLQRGG